MQEGKAEIHGAKLEKRIDNLSGSDMQEGKTEVRGAKLELRTDSLSNLDMQEEKCVGKLSKKFRGFSAPGENRQLSILNGLRDISQFASAEDLVMVHDSARPCLSGELISACFAAAEKCDGAIPVLPMKDTVYLSDGGNRISSLLNRDRVVAGQAPEVFRLGAYLKACEDLLPEKIYEIRGSTEPAIMAGMDIAILPGDERNFKITTAEDLIRFRRIMED
ncbi:MAG: 2-C-methyl-D-erythritol 4-phosphate cytidylyltransferase [Lachnospiraceae bacterium]|nr:2-C-methyl-D-erythritol 4-phosphate cytidylyltransferase [Lachnospiraceae bacterium]